MAKELPTLLASPELRRRPVPRKVRAAVSALVSGKAKTITAAAEQAGLSREHLSRSLSEPHIAEFLRQAAARNVALGAGRASARIVELLDSASEHVSLDASRHTLAIAGIKPASEPQLNVNLSIRAGYVIDLREEGE